MVKFCFRCKKIFPIDTMKCPVCGDSNLMIFCQKCSKMVPNGSLVCPICGDRGIIEVNENKKKVKQKRGEPKSKKPVVFASIIITAIVISLIIYFDIDVPFIDSLINADTKADTSYNIMQKIQSGENENNETSKSGQKDESIVKRPNCDFRNTKWGDSKETVKKYDTTIKIEEETSEIIAGRDSVSGYSNVVVGYTFDSNEKLFRGSYIFLYKERETWKLIAAYEDLLDKLTETYGKPNQSEIVPLTMQDLIDITDPSTALQLGYVMYVSTWTTDTTSINMNLTTTNYQPTLGVVYQDLNYKESTNGL